MEAIGFVQIAAVCVAMPAGLLAGDYLAQRARDPGFYTRAGASASSLRRLFFVRGIPVLFPLAQRLLSFRSVYLLVQDALECARRKGAHASSERAFLSAVIAAAAILWLMAAVVLQSPISGLAVVAGVFALAICAMKASVEKYVTAIRQGVPDSIQAMNACFQAGLSLEQTLAYLSEHSQDELKEAYARAYSSLRLGCPAHQALESLRKEAYAPEFAFVSIALHIQHQTGGSLAQVLKNAEQNVRDRFELERSLRVQTAQARLSARVVSAMPLVLIAVFSLVSQGFLEPFFASFAGVGLFLLAMLMQLIGVVLVRRSLRIEGVSL